MATNGARGKGDSQIATAMMTSILTFFLITYTFHSNLLDYRVQFCTLSKKKNNNLDGETVDVRQKEDSVILISLFPP